MRPALLLALLLAAARPARAQEVELPSIESRDLNLDQVVELAAKRPQPLREAASSSSILTAADLQAYGWRDFTEAIASLAGFYTSDARDSTNFGVRGIALKGDSNGRILILVDGHTQQELWSHSAYPEQMGLDASMIDHIEVLRGPASALYGSLGFLAIINVVTRRGTGRDWANVTYEMQDARGFRGAANFGHLWKNGLEVGLSLQARRDLGNSYDYPDLAAAQAAAPCSAMQLMEFPRSCLSRSDANTDAGTNFSLYGHLFYKGFSLKASYQYYDKNIPFAPYSTIFNEQNRYLLQRGYVDASYQFGHPWQAEGVVRLYYDYAGYADDLTNSTDGTAAGRYVFHDQADPWWIGGDAKLFLERDWKDVLHFAFTAGGEFTFFRGNDVSGQVGEPDPVRLESDVLFGAVYAQAELTYVRKIFLTVGARADFASVYPSAVSPRAGLVLLPLAHSSIKLLYSHGFIHPSWYYTYFDDDVSILKNLKLRPEGADNFELVLQHEIAGLVLTGSLFYIEGHDIIGQTSLCVPATAVAPETPDCPAGMASRLQRNNLASFQSYGAELGVTGKLKHDIRLYANYGWAHASVDGARAFNSPEHLFKLGISVPLWRNHLIAGTELRVISPRLLDQAGTDETPTAVIVNAHVTWRDLPKGLAATLKVYNLTGQTYYEPSTAEASFPILRIPHPGPTVLLRVSYGL